MQKFKVLSCVLVLASTACGRSSHKAPSVAETKSNSAPEAQYVIPVSLKSGDMKLAADASSFSMQLAGCASGATGVATEAVPSFSIYKTDTNCLAKLTSLNVNGIAYSSVNTGASGFTSFAKADTAIFADSSGANKITLTIQSQLSSPVQATDNIRYSFAIIQAGDSKPITSDSLGESHSIAVAGDLVPTYKIDKITFQGLNANGGGRFLFQMECLVAIKTVGAVPSCANLNFTDTSYVLVKDTFSGAPTAVQLAALFPGASVLASQLVSNTSSNLGGFNTAVLEGPNQLALNPKMILVLKNGNSFQYFLVTAQSL